MPANARTMARNAPKPPQAYHARSTNNMKIISAIPPRIVQAAIVSQNFPPSSSIWTPFLLCLDRICQPGSVHDLGSRGDDACGADDGRDREERAEHLLELEVRLVRGIQVRDPRSRRGID